MIIKDKNKLQEKCSPVSVKEGEEIGVRLLHELRESNNGIGLAANQIGINKRVCVVICREPVVLINPEIVEKSEEQFVFAEGCLSFPGLWVKVNRPETIEVEYEDENGEKIQRELYGLQSRIFQHEYDHMEGKNFTDGVSKLKLDLAKKKQKKALIKAQIYKEQEEEREKQMKFGQSLIV